MLTYRAFVTLENNRGSDTFASMEAAEVAMENGGFVAVPAELFMELVAQNPNVAHRFLDCAEAPLMVLAEASDYAEVEEA